ncbi:MAG: hypothetical protein ACREBN_11825, partial [Burkholderiaceae bacterium]
MSTAPAIDDVAPSAKVTVDAGGRPIVRLSGSWRLARLSGIQRMLGTQAPPAGVFVDGSALREIDSAGALALLRWLATATDTAAVPLEGFADNEKRIVEQVRQRLAEQTAPEPVRQHGVLEHLGRTTVDVGQLIGGHLNFLGLTLVGIAGSVLNPGSVRFRELTAQLEQICLNAIPVVSLVTLLIGVVV